jgi:predicted DNA repair protein MutK
MMAGGLIALLDDVALIARKAAVSSRDVAQAAAATSTKAAAVVVDDAAVTPSFVQGVSPARELPIIWRITKGSLVNKIIVILPVILLLSWLAPWALTPILMVGGTYLAFEGAEKIWHAVAARRSGHGVHADDSGNGDSDGEDGTSKTPDDEDSLVKGAVRTDFILSAEIMVLSLNELTGRALPERAAILVGVALLITFVVYGVVGLLVKMDDVGLALADPARDRAGVVRSLGRGLVALMPRILTVLSVVGTAAMLWVGGHILLVGVDELGWHTPYGAVHHLVEGLAGAGGAVQWLVETLCSALTGLIVGTVVVGAVTAVTAARRSANHPR